MATVLAGGVAFGSGDVTVNILGVPVTGVSEINYEEKQDVQNNWGMGNLPYNRGYGKIEATAKIKLFAEEVIALQSVAPGGRLSSIPAFDIIVSYVNAANAVVVDTIKNCVFTNNKREIKSGDTKIEVEIELVVSHIEWGQ